MPANLFAPCFQGELEFPALPGDFASRIEQRVREGLLVRGSRSRANYRVESRSADSISFRAADLSTAISVGLNDVELSRTGTNRLAYRVRLRTWAGYVVALGAAIAVLLTVAYFLVAEMRRKIEGSPAALAFFWGGLVFWGLLWPWILIAIHKRFARRALERILHETLGT